MFGRDQAGNTQLARMEDDNGQSGSDFPCYFSDSKTSQTLDAVMLFKEPHSFVLRVAKTEMSFRPVLGKVVRLIASSPDGSDQLTTIEEITSSALNPEYVVGCKQPW